jgi:hypothetical protein
VLANPVAHHLSRRLTPSGLQNLQTPMIVAQHIDIALDVGAHFDGATFPPPRRPGEAEASILP